jgi:YbgC/YbaW family acyl-CoA thioester hydrolase
MRIKLDLPETPVFKTTIEVTISDINYGNHMGNDRFLTLMQEARLRWLQSLGFKNEKNIAKTVGIIVVDAAIQFKAEVFHGERLSVTLALDEVSSKGFDLYYIITKEDDKQAAIGKTGILCYDYVERKVVQIPAVLKDLLKSG